MNMLKYVTLVALLLLTSFSITHAQTNPPLIAIRQGELYAIAADGQVTQLTHINGYSGAYPYSQEDIHLSPDGGSLVFHSTPAFFTQAMADNLTGNLGDMPSDLMLLDLNTLATTPIAVHEPDTQWNEQGRLYYRSPWGVDWSPDGTQIAYLEARSYVGAPNFVSRLVIYDIASGESHVLAEDTQNFLGYSLDWNESGILINTTRYNPIDGSTTTLYLNSSVHQDSGIHGYVRHDGRDYLALFSLDVDVPDGTVILFDIQSGEYFLAEAVISSVSALSPDDSIIFADDTNDTRPAGVYSPNGDLLFRQSSNPPYAVDFSISPDGQQFAYHLVGEGGGGLVIADAQGSEQRPDFSASAINWGVQQYMLFQPGSTVTLEPTTIFETAAACGTLAPVGLAAGGQGRVLEGSPNRVRSAPSTEAEQIGQIPSGEVFDVVDGQQGVCVDGIRWAQVSYDGVTGWTAEGADGSPFVEPLN
ncbi:MAG: SH3 domain-containing protein [Anaerolineae bacterium]